MLQHGLLWSIQGSGTFVDTIIPQKRTRDLILLKTVAMITLQQMSATS